MYRLRKVVSNAWHEGEHMIQAMYDEEDRIIREVYYACPKAHGTWRLSSADSGQVRCEGCGYEIDAAARLTLEKVTAPDEEGNP